MTDRQLAVSPLVISERIYVLTRLGADGELLRRNIKFFKQFAFHDISRDMVWEAFDVAQRHNNAKHINDIIHIKYAERYCARIVTFDRGYETFRDYTALTVEIV